MSKGNVTYCRLCGELKPITSVLDVENQIVEINCKLSRINAKADFYSYILPKTVCIKCMVSLNGAYEFVLAVERGQNTLSTLNNEIKEETSDELQDNYEISVPDDALVVNFEAEDRENRREVEKESSSLPSAEESISLLERVLKYGRVSPASPVASNLIEENNEKDSSGDVEKNDSMIHDELDSTVNDEKEPEINNEEDTVLNDDEDSVVNNEEESMENVEKNTTIFTKKAKKSVSQDELLKRRLIDPPSTWKEYIWKCSVCDTEFPTHEEMKTHSMAYHKICNVQKCYDCNLRRGTLDHFIMHVRKHRSHLKYSCYICYKIVSSPHEVGLHRRLHRTTPHMCKGCHTIFKNETQLKDHMATYFRQICERNASKIVDRTCKVCAKSFETALSLLRHVKTHTERKKDYTCETCGKCFHNKHVLKGHMTVHTDERPFPCNICEQRFKCRNHLLGHLQTHIAPRQHTCEVCSRSFKFKKHLEVHQIVHTNLLPYVCNFCKKGFRFKSVLSQHLRQHTGDKPYMCSVCHRQFTGWPNYNKHMKRRHNMNMSKRNLVVKDDEISESMKEYVENVCNEKKRGKKLKKLASEVPDQVTSENEEHS